MSDFSFDFGQVQPPPETPQFRACCHGSVQILRDLTEAIRDGTADAKAVEQKVADATQKLPSTVTVEDAGELKAAFAGLKDAVASQSGFAEAKSAVNVSEAVVDLHIKAAEAGAHPTSQQRESLGETAMKLNALVKEQSGTSQASPFLAEVRARAESFIQQAQEANPLFGLSMASAAAPEAKNQSAQPAAKGAWHDTPKEGVVERSSSSVREASRSAEVASQERGTEPVKETVSGGVPSVSSAVKAEQQKTSSESEVLRVETVERRQAAPAEASVVSATSKVVSTGVPSSTPAPSGTATLTAAPTPPQRNDAPSSGAARALSSSPQLAASLDAQRGSTRPAVVLTFGSASRVGAVTAPVRPGVSPGSTVTRAVQRVAVGPSAQAQRAPTPRSVIATPSNRPAGRAAQIVRNAANKASGEPAARNGNLRDPVSRPAASVRMGRERGAPVTSPGVRVDVNGRTLSVSPVQRVATMLAHLRSLSPRELKAIRPDRYDRPADVRVAIAIRARAQKIMGRIKSLPLKDIVKIKGLKAETKVGKGGREQVALSPREALARREVRLLIRDLSARLQSFLNPRSMIYKRVMTELTLADLERLVSILGGARAVKGLRKKHNAGEVTQVFESDISNSFLSQLASASGGALAGGDSGGSSEPVSSLEGAGAEASPEASTEEATLVADGAVPTATLSTFIMKEETLGNSM